MLQGLLEEWAESGGAAIMTTHNVDLGLAWGESGKIGLLADGSVHFREPSQYADAAEFRRVLSASLESRQAI